MIYKCDMCGVEVLSNEDLDETSCSVCDEGMMFLVDETAEGVAREIEP